MISQKEMLGIIRTEAVEHGGLQEIPGRQHGGKASFHSAKRTARKYRRNGVSQPKPGSPSVEYDLRLVRKSDGTLEWRD